MALTLWAGATTTTPSNWTEANRLPSPVQVDITREEIWDANAGRNAKGTMVATYVAQKYTFAIKWGVLTSAEITKVASLLTTGFFKFATSSGNTTIPTSAGTYYRSELSYTAIVAGGTTYYKDATVSVIQK